MDNRDVRYRQLAEKWMNGTITPEEAEEFSAWYHADAGEDLQIDPGFATSREEIEARLWRRIQKKKKSENRGRYVVLRRVAAACIAAIILLSVYELSQRSTHNKPVVAAKAVERPDVSAPQSAKAVLTLDDGSRYYLDSTETGIITTAGTTPIVKQGDGLLSYEGKNLSAARLIYNTLDVPRGSQVVKIVLSDGTKVWLNAGSTMRFPVSFGISERKVELTGEAYFEVAKETSRKFYVDCNSYRTEVLGTHFNVSAYPDELNGKVTLLEGRVRIGRQHEKKSVVLAPGDQAELSERLQVTSGVDTEVVTAWKEGMFNFDNTNVAAIMRQVSRWYDVEVEYVDDVRDKHFTGKIGRHEKVSEVLGLLEMTDVIHFRIEGRKLRIYR